MKLFKRDKGRDLLLSSVANLAVEVSKMRGVVEALVEAFENSGFTMSDEQKAAEKEFMDGIAALMNYDCQKRDRYV